MKLPQGSLVSSLNCGLYQNWGGGLLIKLALLNRSPRVLVFQSDWVFYLQENLKRLIVEGEFSDPRGIDGHNKYEKAIKLQPTLMPADFQSANASSTVSGWSWHIFRNGVAVEIQFLEGDSETYAFAPEVLYLFLDYVDRTIEHGHLIDLRKFRHLAVHVMEEEILNSEGYRLKQAYENFDRSKRLLDRNYEELVQHIQQFQGRITNPDFVLSVRRYRVSIFMEETLRLLHNFVAACTSLIDHSRKFFRRMEKESKPLPDYQEEIDRRFVNDPLTQFVINLRQFAQHYRLPGISTVQSFENNDIRGRVLLIKEDLLRFSNWNNPAKKFLQEQGDEVNILEVFSAYHHKITEFHRWLRQKWNHTFQRELHETELKRQAFLFKKRDTFVSDLRKSLAKTRPERSSQLLELLSPFLSLEEFHELQEAGGTPLEFVRRAVAIADKRYLLPDDLKEELLLTFGSLGDDG
jgi:hypothetical protein